MQEFIEVVFRSKRIGYFYNPKNLELAPDTDVVVKVERGEDIGKVINCSIFSEELENKFNKNEIGKVFRIATEEDYKQLDRVYKKEKEVTEKFQKLMDKYPFEMKHQDTYYQLDGNKLTFFFSADGRVDFRDFVRELATEFKTRIELHQTTGREDAKRYGGLGICGRPFCCVSWLKKFNQVSIQMAKDQNLLSNLSKISGSCGRLLCCLQYEEDFYLERATQFPKINSRIILNGETRIVLKNDYYNNKIYLSSEDKQTTIISLTEYKSLKKVKKGS